MIFAEDEKKWWERPLRCLLGLHQWRTHPGLPSWRVCDLCHGEEEKRP